MRFISIKGEVSYSEANQIQKRLVELRARDACEDTFLFLEHRPVITRGRGLQWTGESRPRQMPLEQLPPGLEFLETERGGDLTYHGPGQWVVYPICKLDGSGFGPKQDVSSFIRRLETLLMSVLEDLGLRAQARARATGVWVGDRKIASIGIAVRKWVTYHGIALNVVNDLKPFHFISPCGYAPEVMTRLKDLLPASAEACGERWRQVLESKWVSKILHCGA